MKENMITGNPAKSLIAFALPMVLGNLFQQFYNIADSVIVGNFVGENALAAVGASFSIVMLFMCFAIGAGIGCSVVISQLLGAGKLPQMKTAISTALITIGGIGLVFSGVGLLINRGLLSAMGTPANIYDDAVTYLGIYFMGMVFLFLYNNISSIFNALGESKIPLYFLIFSSLSNIVLDIWFVAGLHFGVAGAAWATLIAQAAAATLSLITLLHKLKRYHTPHFKLFDATILLHMCKVAIPSVIQQSIVSIGMLLIQTVVNRYGSSVVAGYAAAMKIDSIAIVPMIAVGNAMSTFTAQNVGAGQIDRIKAGYHASLAMVFALGGVVVSLIIIFAEQFVGAFMDSSQSAEAIATGVTILRTIGVFYLALGIMNIAGGILRGAGDILRFMANSLISLAVRVAVAFLFAPRFGTMAIWIATPVGWMVGLILGYYWFYRGTWKNKSLVKDY